MCEVEFFLENGLFEAPPSLPLCRAVCLRATFPYPAPARISWLHFPTRVLLPGLPWLGRDLGRHVGGSLLQPVSFSTSLLSVTRRLFAFGP